MRHYSVIDVKNTPPRPFFDAQSQPLAPGSMEAKPGKELADAGLSRSMRKMLQLKAAAAAAAAKTRGSSQQGQPSPQEQHGDSRQQHVQAPAGQQRANSTPDGPEAMQHPASRKQQQPSLFAGKKLKASKKKFLAYKKAKKKGKLPGLDAALGEKEAALAAAAAASKPEFGEQAAQPLKVHLKRKHWAGDPSADIARRCTAIFERQMAAARAAADAPAAEDGTSCGQRKKKKATNQQQPPNEHLRLHLIEAYRQQKQAQLGTEYGAATAATLAALVGKAVE